MRNIVLALATLLALGACATRQVPAPVEQRFLWEFRAPGVWRNVGNDYHIFAFVVNNTVVFQQLRPCPAGSKLPYSELSWLPGQTFTTIGNACDGKGGFGFVAGFHTEEFVLSMPLPVRINYLRGLQQR